MRTEIKGCLAMTQRQATSHVQTARRPVRVVLLSVLLGFDRLIAFASGIRQQERAGLDPSGTLLHKPTGESTTYSTVNGGIDITGTFFQSLWSNGLSCVSCHHLGDGMSVSAANVQ